MEWYNLENINLIMKKRELEFDVEDDDLLPSNDHCSVINKIRQNIEDNPKYDFLKKDIILELLKDEKIIKKYIYNISLIKYKNINLICKYYNDNNDYYENYEENENNNYCEILVSFYINKLRHKLPNFIFMYGIVFINKIPYSIYEYIDDSFSFAKLIDVCDIDVIKKNIAIVLLSIRYAFIKFKFTHYDLHIENILIKKLEKITIQEYETKNGLINFQLEYLPVIIDFGLSSIKEKYLSDYSFRDIFIEKQSNILHDYHKFIYSIITTLINNGRCNSDNNIKKLVLSLHNIMHPNTNINLIIKNGNPPSMLSILRGGLPKHPNIDQLELADIIVDQILKL